MSSSPILLPISTRSVGFTIRFLISAIRCLLGRKYDFDWYRLSNALYRVTLLRLHAKINGGFRHSFITRHISDEPYYLFEGQFDAIKYIGADFAVIHRILSAIGYVKYGPDCFVPFLPLLKDEQRCDPINVRFTNLREIVTTLANPETSVEIRKHFWQHNPIPGAKWSTAEANGKDEFAATTILSNPNDIIPAKYNVEELHEDINALQGIIGVMGRKYPREIVNEIIDYESYGSRAQFVSSIAKPSRCPSYNDNNNDNIKIPTGELDTFWSPRWLKQNEIDLGVFCLLGEHSDAIKNERLLAIRFEEVATQHIYQSYCTYHRPNF
uniref:Uncharacterized protein n=1 Tax=Bactrocera dorsalis TaxID=27457 RepID=A0A034WB02_BACDO